MDKRNLIETLFHPSADKVCSEGAGGMVAAAHPAATSAGVSMLKKGGNAVDAAVATALALCICEPQACSLGGQSYGLLHTNDRSLFLDGSGRVPQQLEASGLSEENVLLGYRGTSVPTTPLVLACMQKRFGKLSWKEVLEPAMEIAEDGYKITALQHKLQARELHNFKAVSGKSGSRYFLKNGQDPYEPGDLFVQAELARLLKRLADNGVEDFYTGETARRIADDMARHGGFLAKEDLRAIPWPHQRPVIEQHIFGHTLLTSPPPTQGRLLAYILKVAEEMSRQRIDLLAENTMGIFANLFHSAYRIRIEQSPYPDLYTAEIDDILTARSIGEVCERLLHKDAGEVELVGLQGGETTHLSVIDGDGNCVGITQSVNMVYGSKAAADGLGFLYNDYLIDSFALPLTHPHALVPGRFPPCSVAPFILLGADRSPWLTAGSPGSQRIVTALTLFLVRLLHGGLPMDQAMKMPRYHCQDSGKVIVEQGRFSDQAIGELRAQGFEVQESPPFYFGAIHAVLRKTGGEKYQGVAEVRRDGSAEAVAE